MLISIEHLNYHKKHNQQWKLLPILKCEKIHLLGDLVLIANDNDSVAAAGGKSKQNHYLLRESIIG